MFSIPISDPCASIEAGSWLWYLAGCFIPRVAVAASVMLTLASVVTVRRWAR